MEPLAHVSTLALDSAPLIYYIEEEPRYLPHRLKTPDAIHIATALVHKVDALLTNETAWKRVKEVPIVVLEELT